MSKFIKYVLPFIYVFIIILNAISAVGKYNAHDYLSACISFICTVVAIGAFHYFIKAIYRRKKPLTSSDPVTVSILVRFDAPGRHEKVLLSQIKSRGTGSECMVHMQRMAAPMAMHSIAMTLASMAEKEGAGEEFNKVLPQILACAETIQRKQIAEMKEDTAKNQG